MCDGERYDSRPAAKRRIPVPESRQRLVWGWQAGVTGKHKPKDEEEYLLPVTDVSASTPRFEDQVSVFVSYRLCYVR